MVEGWGRKLLCGLLLLEAHLHGWALLVLEAWLLEALLLETHVWRVLVHAIGGRHVVAVPPEVEASILLHLVEEDW